ncbi:MAG: hypothetical protein ABIJ35_00750, partial [Acidobacteriota bacterium]
MNLLVFAGLYDHKLESKISPILALEKVETMFLLRNMPLPLAKVQSFTPPSLLNLLFVREIYKFFRAVHLCLTQRIDYVCGIYFRPHGLLASWIGRLFSLPVILVFIGN